MLAGMTAAVAEVSSAPGVRGDRDSLSAVGYLLLSVGAAAKLAGVPMLTEMTAAKQHGCHKP